MTETGLNFVVFSDDWGRHPSSCQHLFRRIAPNHRVLWVNTIGLRAPRADKFTLLRGLEKLRTWLRPLRRVGEKMWVLSPIMLPVSGHGTLGRLNRRMTARAVRRAMRRIGIERPILWASIPTAEEYVGRLGESAVVYYVTDDYSLWPGGNARKIQEADRRLTERADLVFACNEALAASHQRGRGRTILLPHAVDFEHFARPADEPADLAGIGRPRACFFGLIYEKIDLELLRRLAEEMPDLHLVMIGPVKTDVSALSHLPNVRFLGPRAYESLPGYLQAMDVLVVPYVADEESLAKGPLKIRECLAVGTATVARAIPDLLGFRDVIHLYEDKGGFISAVRAALSLGDEGLRRRMQQRVKAETWESRVETVMDRLSGLLPARGGAGEGCQVCVSMDDPPWADYLAGSPRADLFHDPRWGKVMGQAYGNSAYYLTARRNGEVVGLLQLVFQKSLIFGSHLTSVPYLDASGVLADDDEAARALIGEAQRLMRDLKARWVELRQSKALDEALPCRADKVVLRLDLPASSDALWKLLDAKVRNQVRKAQKAEMTFRQGGAELLADFHNVYARNMRDLGSPPHSFRFFRELCGSFPEAAGVCVVRLGERTVAASLTLTDRSCIHVPWAASDWRFREQCPNMLLYWSMLASACEKGLRRFDFGRSTKDCGTYKFKRQWGAEELPLYWQYLLPEGGACPDLRADSDKYRFAVKCWRKLPVGVARRLGPLLISKLS